MARIQIDDSFWLDERFIDLVGRLGSGRDAIGTVIMALVKSSKYWIPDNKLIPESEFRKMQNSIELVSSGFARVGTEGVYIEGTREQFAAVQQRVNAGRAKRGSFHISEEKKAEVRTATRRAIKDGVIVAKEFCELCGDVDSIQIHHNDYDNPLDIKWLCSGCHLYVHAEDRKNKAKKTIDDSAVKEACKKTWEAYSNAYLRRHGAAPLRNALNNSKIKSFVGRVGLSEAPEVAKFFVEHSNSFYVSCLHPVGVMLRDAEKLRTEWITGSKMTSITAMNAEKSSYHQDQLRRIQVGEI